MIIEVENPTPQEQELLDKGCQCVYEDDIYFGRCFAQELSVQEMDGMQLEELTLQRAPHLGGESGECLVELGWEHVGDDYMFPYNPLDEEEPDPPVPEACVLALFSVGEGYRYLQKPFPLPQNDVVVELPGGQYLTTDGGGKVRIWVSAMLASS